LKNNLNMISLTDPAHVKGQLELLEIYRRERKEVGFGKTDIRVLLEEADILIRLLKTQRRMGPNILEDVARRSVESD
jgi:hypothetical protein